MYARSLFLPTCFFVLLFCCFWTDHKIVITIECWLEENSQRKCNFLHVIVGVCECAMINFYARIPSISCSYIAELMTNSQYGGYSHLENGMQFFFDVIRLLAIYMA